MLHLINNTNVVNNNDNYILQTDEELLKIKKKQSLTRCKEIINRLHWDETLNDVLQHFSFIYKDRFEGNIKISYQEYLNSELKDDLPEHRIQTLIYRDIHIFWDKNKRIDLTRNDEIYNLINQYNNQNVTVNINNNNSKESKKKVKRTIVKVDMLNDKTEIDYDSEDDYLEYYDEYDSKYGKYL